MAQLGPGPKAGKVYKFVTQQEVNGITVRETTLSFWAENGTICMHDEEDGDFRVVIVPEFKARYEALVAQAQRETDISERTRIFQLCNMMQEVLRQAKKQGDPTDPQFIEYVRKHRPFSKTRVHGR